MQTDHEKARAELLADYYRARALVEANSVRASDTEFVRLVSLLIAARRRAFAQA